MVKIHNYSIPDNINSWYSLTDPFLFSIKERYSRLERLKAKGTVPPKFIEKEEQEIQLSQYFYQASEDFIKKIIQENKASKAQSLGLAAAYEEKSAFVSRIASKDPAIMLEHIDSIVQSLKSIKAKFPNGI